ncbi:MAG TPA: FAD-dependent thymidylate synthase [Solirubrobacteraceae bacterium]|jgi:thymidylate synthase (FAD)|nr:FAD-dependent thymidylate synthase [Solirubrobacteraceae bacterium]
MSVDRSLGHGASRAPEQWGDVRLAVVARPSFDRESIEGFLREQNLSWRSDGEATDAENMIEIAGRICYMSFGERQSPKSNREYIRHLIVHGHESVLEHASWSFLISGVSRGFSHQLVRHRVGFAFSQLSQQYVDHDLAETVMPEVVKDIPEAAKLWQASVDRGLTDYRELMRVLADAPSDLAPRERSRLLHSAARSLLPNASETKLAFSANARAIRHLLATRGGIEGDEEMRMMSASLLSLMREEAPSVFEDFSLEQLSDGIPVVRQAPRGG